MSTRLQIILLVTIWSCVFGLGFGLATNIKNSKAKKKAQEQEVEVYISPLLKESINKSQEKFSENISSAVEDAAKKYSIPEYVIYAVIVTESGVCGTSEMNDDNFNIVNEKARSSYDCISLMQVSPKFALQEYNKCNNTEYSREDLYNVKINIDVGTWYFSQFKSCANSWTEMYVIYNVGYSAYNGINNHWYYDDGGNWNQGIRNNYFYMNNMYPPKESWKNGTTGKNKLPTYNGKRRFEKALDICECYFS